MSTTIVQLTDTHLIADPAETMYGMNTNESLKEIVAAAAGEKPQLVLMTGDISQDESEQSYRHALAIAAQIEAPIAYLPGNHDRFVVMAAEFSKFGKQVRNERFLLIGGWIIILLDSTIEGRVEGALSKAELERLDTLLEQHSTMPALVCLHHHPFSVPGPFSAIGVENSDELDEIISRRRNVKAVLCGHIHREHDCLREGVRYLGSPSTCFQFDPNSPTFALDAKPAGYRVLRLHDDGSLETEVRRLPHLPRGLNPAAKTKK